MDPRSVRDVAKAVRDLESFMNGLGFAASRRVTQLKIVKNPNNWFSRDSSSRDPDIDDMDDDIITKFVDLLQGGGFASHFGAYVRENPNEVEFLPSSRGHSVASHYLTVVHELVHDRYQTGYMPTWFAEGMADFVTSLVWGRSLGLEYPQWQYCVEVDPEGVANSDIALAQLSDITSDHALHGWSYTMGCKAVEYLASVVGVRGIFDLAMIPEIDELQQCSHSESPFRSFEHQLESMTATPIETFYSNFQEHRTRGLPSARLPDGESRSLASIEFESSECIPECIIHHQGQVITAGEGSLIEVINRVCDQLIAMDLLGTELHIALDDEPLELAELLVSGTDWDPSIISIARTQGWPVGSGPSSKFAIGYVTTPLDEPAPVRLAETVVSDLVGFVLQVGEPGWMRLGMIEFIRSLVATTGAYDHSPVSRATVSATSLDLSTFEGESTMSDDLISSYGLEALELLVSWRGIQSLADYYDQDLLGEHWRVRFQIAFGMTVEQFYDHFAQHREAGLPDLEIDLSRFRTGSE